MTRVIKVKTEGRYKWTNLLQHAGWSFNKDVIKKSFPEEEAEIIIKNQDGPVDVFITYFFNPKRKWVFYPHGLYEYSIKNIGKPNVKYKLASQVPKYNIYQSIFENGKWVKWGKIGYCLAKESELGSKYLFIPVNFANNSARRKYYKLSKMKIKRLNSYMSKNEILITKNYFIFDVDDDYLIKDNARLMYSKH